jgi:hypothetical protein
MPKSAKPAYDAEAEKRSDLDKGGFDCGYSYAEFTDVDGGQPDCDQMNDWAKKDMLPDALEAIKIK